MRTIVSLAFLFAVSGCSQPAPDDATNRATSADVQQKRLDDAGPPAQPPATSTSPAPAASPSTSLSEPKGAIDPKSVEAAAQVVQRFGALLEERKFAEARDLWSGAGEASGLSEAEFRAAYEKYADIHAEVGAPGDSEGAAGSIYVDVPLKLYGTLKSGGRFTLVGPMSLRRVNDVDGATPEQLRWHIFQSGLKPRP